MNTRHKLSLGLGDTVLWINPKTGHSSTPYKIADILTEDKRITDLDTVVVITNAAGHTTEAYVAELG